MYTLDKKHLKGLKWDFFNVKNHFYNNLQTIIEELKTLSQIAKDDKVQGPFAETVTPFWWIIRWD